MPANSDYAPVLDLNAARQRFMEKSAAELVALPNAEVPLLELLEPGASRRPVDPLYKGAYAFERVESTRLAWYARDFLIGERRPAPEAVPTQLQKDLELVKLRLLECREPRDLDIWLHSAIRVARAINPFLEPGDAEQVWREIALRKCFAELHEFQRRWIDLFRAVAARDAPRMAERAAQLLASTPELGVEAREYLVLAAMSGHLASGNKPAALELWTAHKAKLRTPAAPAFRLLRCHADAASCEAEFRSYAER
jgi:hypothetical protein